MPDDMTSPVPAADALTRIAIVTVNYRIADLVIEAVQSVLDRDHGGRDVEMHVVDNASGDDDVALLRRAHAARDWGSRVVLHIEDVNHGFGRGNDVAIMPLLARADPPDAIMLLNPDARLGNEAVDILARALESDPTIGIAGPAIALPDGQPMAAAFRFPSAASEFSDTLAFGPVARRLAHRTQVLPPDRPGGPVDWVSGAAPMMRGTMLRELGGFDPDFFLYHEEVDLMRRADVAGWTCLYVPEARVLHAEGASTGQGYKARAVPRLPAYRYESWALYHRKAAGQGGALARARSPRRRGHGQPDAGRIDTRTAQQRAAMLPARFLDPRHPPAAAVQECLIDLM